MRIPLLPIIVALIIGVIIDFYISRRIPASLHICGKRGLKGRTLLWGIGIFFYTLLLLVIALPARRTGGSNLHAVLWILYTYITVYLSKFIYVIFDLLGSIPRLWKHSRVQWPGICGIVCGIAVFLLAWWGALINRYNIDVRHVTVEIEGLPVAFDGLTIAQLSDIHTGTYGSDTTFLAKVVDRVNSLNPDVIFFTGDIVNHRAGELLPHTGTLGRLHAPYGVYSVLGNHDYGDYAQWPDEYAKLNDRELLYSLEHAMGWHLLRNNTAWLRAGSDSLAVIGVENIGEPPFSVYGDLKASYPGKLNDQVSKILLSHNPMHWLHDIADDKEHNIALTLSGHTHAMQIELGGISPAALRYPVWGGLYTDTLGRDLYVNIGIGTVGTPMRIGATPEITLITLTAAKGK